MTRMSSVLENRETAFTTPPVVFPKFRTPQEQRTWVREQLRLHGVDHVQVETIRGDCPQQTATQILDGLTHLYGIWGA